MCGIAALFGPYSAPAPAQSRQTQAAALFHGRPNHNWDADLLKRELDHNELEALTLFANGKSADEIAAALGVSQGMAHHYLRVAARKLGARNRVHAVAVAVRNGLIKPTGGED